MLAGEFGHPDGVLVALINLFPHFLPDHADEARRFFKPDGPFAAFRPNVARGFAKTGPVPTVSVSLRSLASLCPQSSLKPSFPRLVFHSLAILAQMLKTGKSCHEGPLTRAAGQAAALLTKAFHSERHIRSQIPLLLRDWMDFLGTQVRHEPGMRVAARWRSASKTGPPRRRIWAHLV